MSNEPHPQSDPGELASAQPRLYQIRIKGHLHEQWAEWFEEMTITQESNGDSLLTGVVLDQAALFRLLRKVRDLGLPLLTVIGAEDDSINQKELGE